MAEWNFENAAHLLRRAAFGGTVEEIQEFLADHASVAEAVEDILDFKAIKKKPPKGGRDFYRAQQKQKRWWLKTMLKTKKPQDALREKMVLYWHNHLCSGQEKVVNSSYETGYMPIQNGLFRRFAGGNYRDLVREFNRDPANLYYLDGIDNYASDDEGIHVRANENFGREVLELFTLGISQLAEDGTNDPDKPNYTESDVHQLARALTGWTNVEKNIGVWNQNDWDGGQYSDDDDELPDPITIFGTTDNNFRIDAGVVGTANDVLQLILDRLDDDGNHQAAMFVCRKLWTWFAYPPPAPGLKTLLEGFAATFVASGYEVKPVLSAIFNHDEFYSDAAKSRTVKNPVDYMVGMFKMLGVKSVAKPIGGGPELFDMLEEMGMQLFEPPNVAGWPGGLRWVTTGTLVNRLEFARRLAESEEKRTRLELSTIVTMGSASASPATVLDQIVARVGLDGSMGPIALTQAQKDAILDFMTDGGTQPTLDLTNEETDDAREIVRGALALVLQSAEAQIF